VKKFRHLWAGGNDRQSLHFLQHIALGLFTLLLLLSFLASDARFYLFRSSDWMLGAVLPAVVVEKTNEARAEMSALPLQRSAVLDEAAKLKAEHMAKGEYFAHYSPDGVSPWYWFEKVGYLYAHAGENLAVHFTDSKKVVDAWMDSPTHRANIENLNYLEIGVGTAKGRFDGHDTVFVVQLFGTPASPLQPMVEKAEVKEGVSLENETEIEVLQTAVLGEAVDTVPDSAPDTVWPIVSEEVKQNTSDSVAIERKVTKDDSLVPAWTFLATTSSLLPVSTAEFASVMEKLPVPSYTNINESSDTLIRIVFTGLALLISALLFVTLLLAVRYHRPWQIIYSVSFLVALWGVTSITQQLWSF
jgi:hypothetical protein